MATTRHVTLVVVGIAVFALAAVGTSAQTRDADTRTNVVQRLLGSLRWHGPDERAKYTSTKDENTRVLLTEVDRFIADSFAPGVATADQVRRGLDVLLGLPGRDLIHNSAFTARLGGNDALLIGVEIWRGSDAINENAMSFRGYKNVGGKYSLVAVSSLDGSYDLYAQALGASPIGGEVQLLAWAGVSPNSPPTVTVKMLGFNGDAIRTIWGPEQFLARTVYGAVRITTGGRFLLSSLPDRLEVKTIVKEYVVTADGPQKTAESEK